MLIVVLNVFISFNLAAKNISNASANHTGYVNAVAFNPNGKQLASVSDDASVKLWRVNKNNLNLQFTLLGHQSFVTAVAYSSNGKYLATGGYDKIIKIWNAEKGTLAKDLVSHTGNIRSLAFSPDGKFLASTSDDNNFKLWNLKTGKVDQDFPYFSTATESIAFSPNGVEIAIAVGGSDQGIKLYNIKTKMVSEKFKGKGSFKSIAFSPDGKYLVSANNTYLVTLWDLEKEKIIHRFDKHRSRVASVSFNQDGRFIASVSDDDTIRLWDVKKGTLFKSYTKHVGGVRAFAFSPDGKSIVSGGADNLVKLWGLDSKENAVKKRTMNMTKAEKAEGRRLQEATLKKQYALNRIAATKKGLLYREPAYWQQYSSKNTMPAIFNGDLLPEDRDYRFAFIYGAYVSTFNKLCKEFIPPGSPGFDTTELTTITQDYMSTTYKGATRELRMKKKFFANFKKYDKQALIPGFGSVYESVFSAIDPKKMQAAKDFMFGLRDDMSRLFTDGECDSGFLQQFEENLYRLGAGIPTLQEDKKTHPYFNKDKKR